MIDIAQHKLQRDLVMIITGFAIVNQRTHKPSRNRRILELVATSPASHIETIYSTSVINQVWFFSVLLISWLFF